MGMNKATFNALEKLFEAEIEAALNEHHLGLVQSKAKIYRELAEQGLAEKTITLGGDRFPVQVTGYALTLAGNFTYCQCHNG